MENSTVTTDKETRQRLLDAAGRLFADRGFDDVSIREICKEAGANLAAVNYYFRDKAGLYRELLEHMVDVAWRGDRERLEEALSGKPPEEKLSLYIRKFIGDLLRDPDEQTMVLQRLLGREMADPSPEFEVVVQKGMRPNFLLLCGIVSEVASLPLNDLRVINCAHSTLGQCLIYGSAKKLSKYFTPGLEFTDQVIDGIARHETQFSLAGIRAIAQQALHDREYACGARRTDETLETKADSSLRSE
jgi:TetR/AcrR family transcriptional regulator, regulator of cefoperazone and chloramphenicol sensitivity